MEIILKQDMTNLGYKDEIVKVKDGYANNYLIPQGYAMVATASNKKIIAENLKQRAFKEEKLRKDAETLVAAYAKITGLKIGAKASENGKIFGSVNSIQLADSIKQQFDIEIDRKRISIKGDSIKTLGTYKATISAYKDLKAEIEFEVVAE
ncbi:MAG TPA: 50S ribosomal protein L9 [Bacteroidales bacterium]|nr:50S ribosomal protein L9 [Bacteroidales bacterium]